MGLPKKHNIRVLLGHRLVHSWFLSNQLLCLMQYLGDDGPIFQWPQLTPITSGIFWSFRRIFHPHEPRDDEKIHRVRNCLSLTILLLGECPWNNRWSIDVLTCYLFHLFYNRVAPSVQEHCHSRRPCDIQSKTLNF